MSFYDSEGMTERRLKYQQRLTEKDIFRYMANARSGSPFSLNRKSVLLTLRNVSSGFFDWGEADILTVDSNFTLIEGEIKISIADFRNDFKKEPLIWKERQQKLHSKYYIMPEYLFKKHEAEITGKCEGLGVGVITIAYSYEIFVVIASKTISDYKIHDGEYRKLARLACFRQL